MLAVLILVLEFAMFLWFWTLSLFFPTEG